ncbi:carbohydrate porin [Yersinia frederiksenii]|uniref:carbohydrate porin n=1 Tax=Yersinia frederiksenii TaxID=29484 RepID=UPI0025AA8024|nr:carbohydrate porin [Yersinia frederiksenii]MDN0119885.1 carbohydrate porin [Yersinia frederiksenii]
MKPILYLTRQMNSAAFYLLTSTILFSSSALSDGLTGSGEYIEQSTPKWQGIALGFEPQQEGLLGDMLGIRPILSENGFNYSLGYLSQLSYNAGGGYNHDKQASYIDQFSLTFQQDLELYTGIPDAVIEGNIVNRNHDNNLTRDRLQDPRVNITDLSQESFGGQSITRLGWLTFARSFADQKLHWRIGLMNKVQDFDQIIPCDFQTLGLCGGKSANSLTWFNWNVHYWGTTLQYKLTDGLTLKTGVMEQNPDAPSRGRAWSWSTKGSKGILLPLELELKTNAFADLPGIYNLGVLYTNAQQRDLYTGVSGAAGATDPNGYRYHNNTWFFYGGFNQQVTKHQDDASRGLSVFYSMSLADQRTNYMHYAAATGIRYRGLFDSRPQDWLGLGVSMVKLSDYYKDNQRYMNQVNNVSDYANPSYSPVPGHSVTAELYYRFRVTSWLELQPDLQYWHSPAGVNHTQDAWVTGLKTVITF